MDNVVDSLENAYQEFVNATTSFLQAKQMPGGEKSTANDATIENFTHRYELFKTACDQAEDFVNYAKQSIINKCVVDEATYYKTKEEEFLVDDVEFEKDVVPGSPIEYLPTMPMTPEFYPDDVTFEKGGDEDDDQLVKK
ncbi:Mediator of RNA polymerase II transcription subunit 32 [Abeliophyllum distichum]|uniref:Mediator of RNA polymerase II transcription subunit 32 n=1 Tax=Abeliophyllum distichum TaxID=126358 RepID=A0ABD1PAQ5_9LAMI